MKKQIFALSTVAAMTAFIPQQAFADDEVKVKTDLPKVEAQTEVKRDILGVDTSLDRKEVKHSEKASGILGMEVRNNENEKLGEIKDLVLDVNSGRVSYAVLAVGGFLGIGEKLIALPPGALKVSTEGNHMLLNADKSRIQAAPGFAATAWPAPGDPAISQFWGDLRSIGAPAQSESEKKIHTDADKKIKVEVDKE